MDFKNHLYKYLDSKFVDELILSLSKERTNSLLLNTSKINKEEFKKMYPLIKESSIIDNAFYYDKNTYQFGKSFLFDNGVYYIMDVSSMLVSYYLDVKDNENVLDMCAAPGGKSIFLALKNKTLNILSNDISYSRCLSLSSNIEKMGITNIAVICNDFSKNYKKYANKFDHIILDAPCSGSAMFRKEIEMKNDWTYEKVQKCSLIQKELIEYAYIMLKNGGTMSYSTCSFSYEENEEIILSFLKNHEDMSLINIENNEKFYRTKDLKEAIHLFPNLFDGEGQFLCILKKDGTLSPTQQNTNKNNKFSKYTCKYPLNFKNYEVINSKLYGFNDSFDLTNLSVLRRGLLFFDIEKDIYKPTFALAHALTPSASIELDEKELKLYLHGDVIIKENSQEDGYYTVSFNGINLGFVKKVKNQLKNLYPKGLRH